MAGADLVLRDIHQMPAPSWWPPAPGWWLVFAAVVIVVASCIAWALRRRRRRAMIAEVFDRAVRSAATPSAEVAAMSDLLRRAARRRNPAADRLQGDAWLAFLDGGLPPRPPGTFSNGAGRLLLEGGYQRQVDAAEVAALRPVARALFLHWRSAK